MGRTRSKSAIHHTKQSHWCSPSLPSKFQADIFYHTKQNWSYLFFKSDSASQFFTPWFQLQIMITIHRNFGSKLHKLLILKNMRIKNEVLKRNDNVKLTNWIWTIHGKNKPVLFYYMYNYLQFSRFYWRIEKINNYWIIFSLEKLLFHLLIMEVSHF